MSDAGQHAGAGLIRHARHKAGLTQGELAKRAGVPRETVSAYERSVRQPTLPTLSRMLKAAGYELRLHLEPYDDHDDVLAALEQHRSEVDRERWETYQTARVARDRASTAAALRSQTGRHGSQ